MKTQTVAIPGYRTGTWLLDPSHSEVSFTVSHMMISKVRGSFRVASATAIAPHDPLQVSVHASVDVNSLDTGVKARDNHLRSIDFFDLARYPTMEFTSTGTRFTDGEYLVDGDLTIRGMTKPVTFAFVFHGFGTDQSGAYKAAGTAKTVIDREDFGLTWNAALEAGGVLVGREVTIELELEFTHGSDEDL